MINLKITKKTLRRKLKNTSSIWRRLVWKNGTERGENTKWKHNREITFVLSLKHVQPQTEKTLRVFYQTFITTAFYLFIYLFSAVLEVEFNERFGSSYCLEEWRIINSALMPAKCFTFWSVGTIACYH